MLAPGTQLAGYRIEGLLGRGGMGVVYEATQLSLNRAVALKLLGPRVSDEPALTERLRREALAQAKIDHPNVVTVHETGESEHGVFIAMQLVRGRTLKAAIRSGELTPTDTIRILTPIAAALDVAHAAGLVHRDIKPQNILLGPHDHPYLADFGIVATHDSADQLTDTGRVIGTPDYLAPEQILGERATAASDVYALAAVLFEGLTGRAPFEAPTPAARLYARLSAPPPSARAIRSELPVAVDDVLARGLARNPKERPVSAAELMRQAARALDANETEVAVPRAAPPRRPAGRIALIAAAVAAAIVGIGSAALFAASDGNGPIVTATPSPTATSTPVKPSRRARILITAADAGLSLREFARRNARIGRTIPGAMTSPPSLRGTIVAFQVIATGFEGETLVIRWSLFDARTARQLASRKYADLRIEARTDDIGGATWIEDPKRAKRFYIRLELYDGRKALLHQARTRDL